jgi:hypothetical protein
VFGGEEGRKTLEEEILDSCGHGVHGYVQAVQVNILIRKMTLLTIKASVSNLNNFIPISNPPPLFYVLQNLTNFLKSTLSTSKMYSSKTPYRKLLAD